MKTYTVEEYLIGSKEGRWCAVVGCEDLPSEKCPRCGAHYCKEHIKHHYHEEE